MITWAFSATHGVSLLSRLRGEHSYHPVANYGLAGKIKVNKHTHKQNIDENSEPAIRVYKHFT